MADVFRGICCNRHSPWQCKSSSAFVGNTYTKLRRDHRHIKRMNKLEQAEKKLNKVALKWNDCYTAWFEGFSYRVQNDIPPTKHDQKVSDALDRAEEELTTAKQEYIAAGGSLDW